MSFNIGKGESKFVMVSNVTMKFAFSEKVVFAVLRTSRKTTDVDRTTRESVSKRVYTNWEGRFVGNALEPAKALRNGQAINIENGWLEKETKEVNGHKYTNVYAVISDFTLCESKNESDSDDMAFDEMDLKTLNCDI